MRYVSFWQQQHDEYSSSATADQVIEADKAPQKTGLLDHTGAPLYRLPETIQFGFVVAKR